MAVNGIFTHPIWLTSVNTPHSDAHNKPLRSDTTRSAFAQLYLAWRACHARTDFHHVQQARPDLECRLTCIARTSGKLLCRLHGLTAAIKQPSELGQGVGWVQKHHWISI